MIEKYRLFHDGALSEIIELDSDNAHKVRTVLRLEVYDKLNILTREKFALAEVSFISKNKVAVHIISERDIMQPKYDLIAYQAITKREYMDTIIEKYAELGVTKIIPVVSSRSFNNIKENTLERYRNIAISAVLQSEGEFIPEITKPIDIKKIDCNADMKILFHERVGEKRLPNALKTSIAFIIGSEGGFTESEYNLLIEKGFKPYSLMGRVLKAETSATVFSAMLMAGITADE